VPLLDPLEHQLEKAHGDGGPPLDIELRRRLIERSEPFLRWFSPAVQGVENLPESGPVLLIGNHSGFYFMPDVFVVSRAVAERRGIDAPFHVAAYDLVFALPVIGTLARRLGGMPADMRTAEQALRDGELVLVYPGGDWEACRPWRERGQIEFAGHKGFVRLALRTGAPVVPVVAHGSHDSVVILDRGDRLARLLGLGRLRIKVFPIIAGFPWGLSVVFPPPIPLPSAVTVRFLPPLSWSSLEPDAADDPATVDACYEEITARLQRALDELHEADPHPLRRGCRRVLHRGR
jgi:1-acyl-sn-glycerol-3-phosphate acyltransferase